MRSGAAEQLADEAGAAASAFGALVGRSYEWRVTVAKAADEWVDIMERGKGREAAAAAQAVMAALWRTAPPEQVGAAMWWRTGLGLLVARSLPGDMVEVPQRLAAAMLGVQPGTVAQLVHRGALETGPGSGVLRSAVLGRLVRLAGPDRPGPERPVVPGQAAPRVAGA